MQHAKCFVQLSGDLGTKIAKAPVTPAEVVVLMGIHGPDAVQNVELLGGVNDKTPHGEEIARLRLEYTAMDENGRPVIDSIFPGLSPKLPTTFSEIGIDVSGPKDTTPAPVHEEGQLSVADLKAQLAEWGIEFKGNASKKVLEALYDEALEAGKTPGASED